MEGRMKDFEGISDDAIKKLLKALPEEEVSPATRVELLERIAAERPEETPVKRVAFQFAGIFAVICVTLLISVIPTFNSGTADSGSQAMTATGEENVSFTNAFGFTNSSSQSNY